MKREAEFGTLFRHWIRKNPPKITCHFELKQTQKDSIPFNSLEEHQAVYGRALRDSDRGVLMRNMSGNGEPDYTYFYRDPVFIVVRFPSFFSIIDLRTFEMESEASKLKSLTAQRAKQIAQQTVEL